MLLFTASSHSSTPFIIPSPQLAFVLQRLYPLHKLLHAWVPLYPWLVVQETESLSQTSLPFIMLSPQYSSSQTATASAIADALDEE